MRVSRGDGQDPTHAFPVHHEENNENGPISTTLAQRIAADCANDAAYAVLSTMTKPPPPQLYTLCTSVRAAYTLRPNAAVRGSRVKPSCDPRTKPVIFGMSAPQAKNRLDSE